MQHTLTPLFRETGPGNLRVATLGDEPTGSTCSIAAVEDHLRSDLAELKGFETFEDAAEDLARGDCDVAVIGRVKWFVYRFAHERT